VKKKGLKGGKYKPASLVVQPGRKKNQQRRGEKEALKLLREFKVRYSVFSRKTEKKKPTKKWEKKKNLVIKNLNKNRTFRQTRGGSVENLQKISRKTHKPQRFL